MEKRYKAHYMIAPQFMGKMRKVFDFFHLEWKQDEWVEGEMSGYVYGDKENVEEFLMTAFQSKDLAVPA